MKIKTERKKLANAKYNAKMKEIHKDDDPIECPECLGHYYPVNRSHHFKTDRHKNAIKIRILIEQEMKKNSNFEIS
jgi:hypothetical protein